MSEFIFSQEKTDPLVSKLNKLGFLSAFSEGESKLSSNSIWAFLPYGTEVDLPRQGFKLHVSANILNFEEIFEKCHDYFISRKIAFKVARSSVILQKLNSGLFGYSQSGKFITIYPLDDNHSIQIAEELDKILGEINVPKIPSDRRFKQNSAIFYRYGVMDGNKGNEHFEKKEKPFHYYLINPENVLVLDSREPGKAAPDWIKDPFQEKGYGVDENNIRDILLQDFKIQKTLRLRPKGGVFLAQTNSPIYPAELIIKEGWRNESLEPSGIDAYERLKWEANVLRNLSKEDVSPEFINYVEKEEYSYLLMEKLEGDTLRDKLIKDSFKPYLLYDGLNLLEEICSKICYFHEKGIYLFDLTVDNVFVSNQGIRLIDFECAIGKDCPIPMPWKAGTPGFVPHPKLIPEEYIASPFYSSESLIFRDIFSVSGIAMAIFLPKWYKEITQGKYRDNHDWGFESIYTQLPNEIVDLLRQMRNWENRFSNVKSLAEKIYAVKEPLAMPVA